MRRQEPQQQRHAPGPANAAHAVQAVEAGHHGPPGGLLHKDGLNGQGHVHHPDGRPEKEKAQGHQPNGLHRSQQRKQRQKDGAGNKDDFPASEPPGNQPGKRHGKQRPRTHAQEQHAEDGFVEAEPGFGVGNQRGP